MQLYALTDQGTAALHQYELCTQALEEELGVPPEQATQQLYQDIKENRNSPRDHSLIHPFQLRKIASLTKKMH